MSAERYRGGHNPSLDADYRTGARRYTVVEPATYADDFVCTCVVCGKVFRSRPKRRVDGLPGWESIEPLLFHSHEHESDVSR